MYLNSYLVGEGLSGFLPAVFALAQGVGGNPKCVNTTDVGLVPETPQPRFSVDAFFFILMAMMALSLAAFVLMNTLRVLDPAKVVNGEAAEDDIVEKVNYTCICLTQPE